MVSRNRKSVHRSRRFFCAGLLGLPLLLSFFRLQEVSDGEKSGQVIVDGWVLNKSEVSGIYTAKSM